MKRSLVSSLLTFFVVIAIVAIAGLSAVGFSTDSVEAKPAADATVLVQGHGGGDGNVTASCVSDFFDVAMDEYGWTPKMVVNKINTDADPNFQVANVGDLRQKVANAEIGIFDTSGVYHICPSGG